MEGQYNLRSPAVKRLMKEAQELREPTEQYHAQPLEDNLFEWHFTIRGPVDSEFDGGLYHGRIILPPEYPMKPPSIILLTPNGRFEIFKKICLSISGHHPESWQPSWSIRTALLAIIGFMPTHGHGAIGSLDYTPEERKVLARKSQEWKCSECGTIRNRLRPVTEASKKTTEEAKELASQIDFQGEKEKKNSAGSASPVKAASEEKQETGSGSGAEGSMPSSPSEAGAAGPASSAAPGSTAQPAGTFPMMPPGMFMPPFMNPLLMQNMRQQGAQGAQRMPQFPPNFWPMGSPAGGSGAQGQGQFRFPMMPPGSFPNNTFPSSFSFPSTSATATPTSSSSSTSSNTVSSVSQSPVQSSPAQSNPQIQEAVRDDAGSSNSPAQPSGSPDSQAGTAVTDGLRQRQTERAAARAAAPINQTPQPAELPRQHQPQSLSAYLRSENTFVLFFMALLALAIILLVARRLYKLGPDLDFNRI